MKNVFSRYSISLDDDTVRICRELADAQAQSLSATIRHAVHEAHRKALKKGRLKSEERDGPAND
jgi:hypothetical protein